MKHDDCHDYSSYNEHEWNGFFFYQILPHFIFIVYEIHIKVLKLNDTKFSMFVHH